MSLITRLYVKVLEARGVRTTNACEGAYVKLRAGNHKSRTKAVKGRGCFVWNEEFVFRVEKDGEIEVGVLYEAGCGVDEEQLVGCVRVPFCMILDGGKKTPPPMWFSLEGKHLGHAGCKTEFSGSILLTALLYGRSDKNTLVRTDSHFCIDDCYEQPTKPAVSPIMNIENLKSLAGQTEFEETPPDHEDQRFIHEKREATTSISKNCNSPGFMCGLHHDESIADVNPPSTFEELIGIMQSRDNTEMPENLQGGVLLDQIYMIEPHVLNSLLFRPNSIFRRDLTEVEGTCDYQEGPWTWNSKDIPCLRRSVSCQKAATKLIKAVKAIEEQSYLKADGKNFAVITRTRTPDVPYGDCFEVDLMYRITPILQLPSCDESTRLVISWNIVFCQSTVMKGMIVGTARQGLKESYEIFATLLAQHIRPAISSSGVLDKNHLLAPLELFHQSDWLSANKYFLNFTVFFAICIWTYVLVHILLSRSRIHCLEFSGIDLPDTFGEIFISGILILQGERVFHMIVHFIRARWQRGSDHGVKAQGNGWLLTVALIGGNNLPATASGQSDPYVVFSCNGRTRTSSVQLQTLDPQWNEILEFDAMEEPPAVLDVEVFHFDGPFDLEFSLGHAEINFLKHTSDELTDLWAPLEGELAQISQSKLHLKIFLENTKGVETVKNYLTKMEKEVGKKLKPRSTQKNSTFQEIFSLPPEEFLIKDFSCYLKRKLPLQGRIFISARIVGFY